MHFMPDTEDADSEAERFWPEGYKQVIREDLCGVIAVQLNNSKWLNHVYHQQYRKQYKTIDPFESKIIDMLTIGAENGADDAFDDVIDAFLTESQLPEIRRYARYLYLPAFQADVTSKLQKVITKEYTQDDIYDYAYKVGYQRSYLNFGEFISQVGQLVVTGAMNGLDNVLEVIYSSFISDCPLPPARRHPRRLKVW